MEVAVRWSPHSTPDRSRFLVVDVAEKSLTLNEITNRRPRKKCAHDIEYRQIAHHAKLPPFAAFDWSKTQEDIVALGLTDGSASLVQLRPTEQGGSSTLATYKIKQRQCYSIAMNTQDWLALAVDKTRSDVCLFVYDTQRFHTSTDPIRRLCAAELVSSVKFFPSQPQEIVASTQRAFIRLYDLRDGSTQGNAPTAQASTRNVNNIFIDPMDENYFASGGSTGDPSVSVWDKRWLSPSPSAASTGSNTTNGAVFEFRPAVSNTMRASIWSIRYSGQCRGRLGICSSTGELRVIDMLEGPNPTSQTSDSYSSSPVGSWSSNRYVSSSRTIEAAHITKQGEESRTRIAAYDWCNETTSTSAQPMIVIRPNREAGLLQVPTAKPAASITHRQDLAVAFSSSTIIEPASEPPKPSISGSPWERTNGVSAEDFVPRDYAKNEDGEISELGSVNLGERNSSQVGRLLAPGTIYQTRCRQGYLFDCAKNTQIVAGNWQLERLWEIVNRLEEAAKDGMIYGGLDLSYVGISGLWSEEIGSSPHRRLTASPVRTAKAIAGLNAAKAIPAFEGERTHFPEHRQLCLMACGWKFTLETLEAECQELIERGLYYQAIVQAVLHEYKHVALNLLRTLIRSKTIQNIGLGALLASDHINDEQREMCMWMAADTDDPALKALLTFLNTGDWRDVMKPNYLHLGYRLALGLKYLNDTELSGFIQTETARAVKNGDLEGIMLTGLGEQSMDLFQTYIARTNDLQTAVLATAFTAPKYIHDDIRWEMWKDTYFAQMQSWRCAPQRAKFTVLHNRMARTKEGRSLATPPPPQVELSCLHCQASLGQPGARNSSEPSTNGDRPRLDHNNTSNNSVTGPVAQSGTVCPRCGRHLPRCGICQLWLGTPKPNPLRTVSAGEITEKVDEVMAGLLTFCVSCAHGHHADHAKAWFAMWDVCPVPDCRCMCGIK